MTAQDRLISTAQAEEGYLGKTSSAQLDDPKANAGGKFTKFARDLDALGDLFNGRKNGYDWCAVFVIWCFVQAFGRALAQEMLNIPNHSLAAGAGYALNYYKAKGRMFSTPQPGDQVFFGDAKTTKHTGLVVRVDGGFVYTIEGNAGSPSAVRSRKYKVGASNIKGYGRPDWALVSAEKEEDDMNQEKFNEMFGTAMRQYRQSLQDNDSGEWSKAARQFAVEQGIFVGGGNSNFMWEDLLTREQCAQVLYRFAQKFGLA